MLNNAIKKTFVVILKKKAKYEKKAVPLYSQT